MRDEQFYVGIDLGGMSAKCACLSGGALCPICRTPTSREDSPEATVSALARLAVSAAERASLDWEQIGAVGVGAPGIVDSGSGRIVNWTNFGWRNVPLAQMLQEALKKPVYCANDANAAALGEAKYGAGSKFSSSVLITIGTGIGSGIVLNGALYEGFQGAGAEVGHTVIDFHGRPCSCGRRGCLEAYASARALVDRVKDEVKEHSEGLLAKVSDGKIDGKTLFLALGQGDRAAEEIFSEYVAALGEGIVNVVNLLRPEAVLIGGGISAQGETLLSPLREYVFSRLLISANDAPLVLAAAKLGNDAGLYGAAEYARSRLRGKAKKSS